MKEMNHAKILGTVFDNTAFKKELAELSHYCSSIKQERQIMALIAKFLSQRYVINLEYKKKDMLIDSSHIEVKYNFDCDVMSLIDSVKGKSPTNINSEIKTTKNIGWKPYLCIARDILHKKPDCFLWIVVSRNLSDDMTTKDHSKKLYCWAEQNLKYYNKFKMDYKQTCQKAHDAAINYLKILTNGKGKPSSHTISTEYDSFASIYNFILLPKA